MLVVLVLPLLLVLYTSVYDNGFTLHGYQAIWNSALYRRALLNTVLISCTTGAVATVLGYAVAYHLSQLGARRRALYLILVMMPFWTSILVKSFAFIVLLGSSGVLNAALKVLFGEGAGVSLLFNRTGLVIGLVHWLLPFAVFPILNNLNAQDTAIKQAARLMGATRGRIFRSVTLPLSVPGITAAFTMCTVIATGSIVTPQLLGGRRDGMLANLVDFYVRETLDWTIASAIAVSLLVLVALALLVLSSLSRLRFRAPMAPRMIEVPA